MTYLSDFLRSFSVAQGQTLGNMTIIPLVSREVAPLQLASELFGPVRALMGMLWLRIAGMSQ